MSNPVLEELARKFVHDVRNHVLAQQEHHFLGTWAVVQNNVVFKRVIEGLDDGQQAALEVAGRRG